MPGLKPKKSKFAEDELVVCWVDFAGHVEGTDVVVTKGSQYYGSHPIVRAHPYRFINAETPNTEWPSEWEGREPPQHKPEFSRPHEPIPEDEQVVCVLGLIELASGRHISKGAIIHRNDPLVQANRRHFRVLGKPLE